LSPGLSCHLGAQPRQCLIARRIGDDPVGTPPGRSLIAFWNSVLSKYSWIAASW
jgi:hypothetical protein